MRETHVWIADILFLKEANIYIFYCCSVSLDNMEERA